MVAKVANALGLNPMSPETGCQFESGPSDQINLSSRFGVPYGLLHRDRVGSNPTGEANNGDVA